MLLRLCQTHLQRRKRHLRHRNGACGIAMAFALTRSAFAASQTAFAMVANAVCDGCTRCFRLFLVRTRSYVFVFAVSALAIKAAFLPLRDIRAFCACHSEDTLALHIQLSLVTKQSIQANLLNTLPRRSLPKVSPKPCRLGEASPKAPQAPKRTFYKECSQLFLCKTNSSYSTAPK